MNTRVVEVYPSESWSGIPVIWEEDMSRSVKTDIPQHSPDWNLCGIVNHRQGCNCKAVEASAREGYNGGTVTEEAFEKVVDERNRLKKENAALRELNRQVREELNKLKNKE
jgi:hypothetical protein